VRVPGADYDQIRQYSVSNAPDGTLYRIGVKRDTTPGAPNGLISNFLHDHIAVGDDLLTHVPLGEFVMDETSDRPIVLLSGGSGITATLSLLHALAARADHPEVVFVHATTCRRQHAFAEEVRRLARQHPNIKIVVYYEQADPADTRDTDYEELGRLSLATLAPYLPAGDADYYYCGPIGFMNAVGTILDEQGVPLAHRHSEAFAPDPSFETKTGTR
jgi:nitric oxide dioxygenase